VKRASDWLRQAERDLEEVEYAKRGGYYELACFLSQQAAEKAAKALLQYLGIERRSHSVLHLLRMLQARWYNALPTWISTTSRLGILTLMLREPPTSITLRGMPMSA